MKTSWWMTILLLLLSFGGSAQPYQLFGGERQDHVFDIQLANDKVIVVGSGFEATVPNISDGFVLKTDKELNLITFTYYPDTLEEEWYFTSIAIGDTLYVGGDKTNQCCDTVYHYAAALYRIVGGILDTTIVHEPFGAEKFTSSLRIGNHLYFIGSTYNYTTETPGNDANDPYIVKTDLDGTQVWMKHPGTVYFDNFYGATVDTSGAHLLCVGGSAAQVGTDPYYDGYVVKLDTEANVVWRKSYKAGLQLADYFTSVVATPDGGGIAVGYSTDPSDNSQGPFIVRFDANGDTVWTRLLYRFYEPNTSAYNSRWRAGEIWDVDLLESGDFVFAGNWYNTEHSDQDIFICKYSANGDSLWRIELGDQWGHDKGLGIAVDEDGYIYAAGSYRDTVSAFGGKRVLLIKLDANGCTVDSCLVSSLLNFQTASTNPFSLYPNPAEDNTRIELANASAQQDAQLFIRDINGRIVLHQAVSNNASLSVASLPSGVYITELLQRNGERYYQRFVKQ